MANDAKLRKVILGPDWIDLSYGEPKVVMQALHKQLNRFGSPFKMPDLHDLSTWEYQPPEGSPEFVSFLEDKFDAKVVVCNGAKQALAASLYALSKKGVDRIYYSLPYYPANPSLVSTFGMFRSQNPDIEAVILTSPNNPDGVNMSNEELLELSKDRYAIHDAAYYTPIYLPEGQSPIKVGDVQIYSASKMYGVSGLRIGYAVCHNEQLHKDMVDYMELTTAGVSIASQEILLSIEKYFHDHPEFLDAFNKEARQSLLLSREMLKDLDPEVLEVIPSNSNSMFAWCKTGPRYDGTSAKVYALDGTLFGQPGYTRLNIAHPPELIREAVARLNKHKI